MLKGKCEFSAAPAYSSTLSESKRGCRPLTHLYYICEKYFFGASCHGKFLNLCCVHNPNLHIDKPIKMVRQVPCSLAKAELCSCTSSPPLWRGRGPSQTSSSLNVVHTWGGAHHETAFCFEEKVLLFKALMVVPKSSLARCKTLRDHLNYFVLFEAINSC